MRQLAIIEAEQGERLTLYNFGNSRWGFVPAREIMPLPRLWPAFNPLRTFLVDLWNTTFCEAKTEVTVPIGTKIALTVGTESVEGLVGSGVVEAIIDQNGFSVDGVVYDYQIFGEGAGLRVTSLPVLSGCTT